MKLITMSCTAMLAIAPATVGFAQDTSYPDQGSIAKTGPAPEKGVPEKEGTSASQKGVLGTAKGVLGTAKGALESAVEPITNPPSMKKDSAPTENE
jgi:hypothetical protein